MNLKSQDCGESGFMESLQAEVSILQSYQVFSFVRDYAWRKLIEKLIYMDVNVTSTVQKYLASIINS